MKIVLIFMALCIGCYAEESFIVNNGVVIEKYRIVYQEWDKNAKDETSCSNRFVGVKIKLKNDEHIIVVKKLSDKGSLPNIDQEVSLGIPKEENGKIGFVNGVKVYDYKIIKTANQSLKGRM